MFIPSNLAIFVSQFCAICVSNNANHSIIWLETYLKKLKTQFHFQLISTIAMRIQICNPNQNTNLQSQWEYRSAIPTRIPICHLNESTYLQAQWENQTLILLKIPICNANDSQTAISITQSAIAMRKWTIDTGRIEVGKFESESSIFKFHVENSRFWKI